mmetsp:Transcript_3827/g.10831  ORF Transcript_3827/g.10831 Transcript_3827/m.10831 type:complete len:200 (-) Transcript_3827:19-618(-)
MPRSFSALQVQFAPLHKANHIGQLPDAITVGANGSGCNGLISIFSNLLLLLLLLTRDQILSLLRPASVLNQHGRHLSLLIGGVSEHGSAGLLGNLGISTFDGLGQHTVLEFLADLTGVGGHRLGSAGDAGIEGYVGGGMIVGGHGLGGSPQELELMKLGIAGGRGRGGGGLVAAPKVTGMGVLRKIEEGGHLGELQACR